MLWINELKAEIDGKEVLKGLNLEIKPGEIHAIMGPNGSGKSSLSKIIAGHPDYSVTGGEVKYEVQFDKKNLLDMAADERAKEGIFLAYQYPVEIPGVSNINFLRASYNAICKHHGTDEMNESDFLKFVETKLDSVKLNSSFLTRGVNEGFSGGEKKRNEILQMAVLQPRLAILDETDSGLDIDSLKVVAEAVNKLRSPDRAMLMITHYQRLLDFIVPDVIHVLVDGKIVKTGDRTLALELEKYGYDMSLH